MEMKGEQRIPAAQQAVWDALNDPQMLKACVPGCESIEPAGENAYQVLMVARVGPVSAKFKGRLTLSDIHAPQSYAIAFEGQGGAAGFAKGGAKVHLSRQDEQTVLAYDVKASVGGKLAQIGSRLVDAAAKKIADDFFRNFNEKMAAQAGDPEATVVLPKDEGEDRPAAEPGERPLPRLSNTTVALFAAGALLVVLAALIALLG
ncbi:MAG TPA: carbon monoxide dehydrogenase subunit G [Burkholderiales bacterium]|nr:carbon monoxide dehydrogenase subunit G [Burkholderiales bacterium]